MRPRERALWIAAAVALPVGVLLTATFAYDHLRTPRFHYQYLGQAPSPAPSAAPTRLCPSHSPEPGPTSKAQALAATPKVEPPVQSSVPVPAAQVEAAVAVAEADPTLAKLTRNNFRVYGVTVDRYRPGALVVDVAVAGGVAGDFALPWLDTRACQYRFQIVRVARAQGAEVVVDLESRRITDISLYNNIAAHDRDDRE